MATVEDINITISDEKDLKLLVCSWNVGNKAPCESLDPWIPNGGGGYDVIVVGVQEATYKKNFAAKEYVPKEGGSDAEESDEEEESPPMAVVEEEKEATEMVPGSTMHMNKAASGGYKFFKRVAFTLGDGYVGIENAVLMQMGLIICVKKSIQDQIKGIESAKEATGLGGVVGNKGGLIIKFNIGNISLAFCTTHLAAHRGKKFCETRHSNIREILDGAFVGNKTLDFASQFTHVFWMGDMNYRVDLNDAAVRAGKADPGIEKDDMWKTVVGWEKAGEYSKIASADELTHAIEHGIVLTGFKEGPRDTIKPTFKVLRKPGTYHKKNRIPSYCDRILWKSMAAHAHEITQLHFKSFEEMWTSDHKPVQSAFSIKQPEALKIDHTMEDGPVITLTNFSAKDLKAADLNGKSDPYIAFHSYPPCVFTKKEEKPPKCKHITKTLSPVFKDETMPKLYPKVASPKDLEKVSLIIGVVDYDLANDDDLIGVVKIPFAEIMASKGAFTFEKPVLAASTKHGTLSGTINIVWPHDESYDEHAAIAKPGGCCVIS